MERKTRTTVFAFKPSAYEKFKKIAHMQATTMSDIIQDMVDEYVAKYPELIKAYDDNVVPIKKKSTAKK